MTSPWASEGDVLRRKALRRKPKRLRKLACEGLVPDDEGELDDLRCCEMFPKLHEALVRHLEVVAGDPLAEFERGALSLTEMRAPPIDQNVGELLCRDTHFHADGVADVHSIGHAVERGHLHVEQRAKLSIDLPEPLNGTIEAAEPQHER